MSKILKLQNNLRVQWQDNNTGKYNETSYFGTEINDDGTNIIIVNASDPNFADVTIPFAAVSQPLFATITELRDDLRCTVLEKTGRLLHFPESNNIIPAPCLGLQNVGATLYWNGTAISTGQHTPNIITGVDNALSLLGTTAVLGGTLSQNTQIITSNFNFGITGNIGLTGIINLGGTSIIRGVINLLPASVNSTSSNKSLRLANTTGNLSLVNEGMYATKSIYWAGFTAGSTTTPITVTIPTADGLVINTNVGGTYVPTNFQNLSTSTAPFIINSKSSRIISSSADDFTAFGNGFTINAPNIPREITITATLNTNINSILVPFIHSGYPVPSSSVLASSTTGGPQFAQGYGYSHGTYCKAAEDTIVTATYTYYGFGANMGNIGFYRNLNVTDLNDATPLIVSVKHVTISFKQLDV